MIRSSTTSRVPVGRDAANPKSFLASYRALSVCTRELARLAAMIIEDVSQLPPPASDQAPAIRQTPARFILQLGPVALTMAWLRSTLDSAASGELLLIVWNGEVAPHRSHYPERSTTGHRAPAVTALWEESYTAVATSEATWTWQRTYDDMAGLSSSQLAARCVERLRVAHAHASANAPTHSASKISSSPRVHP